MKLAPILIGAGLLGLAYAVTRPKKDESVYLPPPNLQPTPEPLPAPTPTPTPAPTVSNFDAVKKYFSGYATTYADRIELSFLYDGKQRKIIFYNNNRFFIFNLSVNGKNWIKTVAGDYANGGQKLTVTEGLKSGQIITGNDILLNLKKAI